MRFKSFLLLSLIFIFVSPSKVSAVDLNVSASVPSCDFSFRIKPEKRIPSFGNDSTIITLKITDTNNLQIYQGTFTTDSFGTGIINFCDIGVYPTVGNYNFYFKGISSLRKLYSNVNAFGTYTTFIDFSNNGSSVLLSGDIDSSNNNFINALDLSTLLNKFYSNDYKADLNQDGVVNAQDLSILLDNFYKSGD